MEKKPSCAYILFCFLEKGKQGSLEESFLESEIKETYKKD
jgi:hypothetical protein